MSIQQLRWQWTNSVKTDRVSAALAWYNTRITLINYLLKNVDESQYNQLQIVSHKDVIILIGHEESLPWFDGISYAGYDDIEPRIWRPSYKVPCIPLSLLADSLCQHYQLTPLLIWDNPKVIIPFNHAQLVDKRLLNILAEQCGNT